MSSLTTAHHPSTTTLLLCASILLPPWHLNGTNNTRTRLHWNYTATTQCASLRIHVCFVSWFLSKWGRLYEKICLFHCLHAPEYRTSLNLSWYVPHVILRKSSSSIRGKSPKWSSVIGFHIALFLIMSFSSKYVFKSFTLVERCSIFAASVSSASGSVVGLRGGKYLFDSAQTILT